MKPIRLACALTAAAALAVPAAAAAHPSVYTDEHARFIPDPADPNVLADQTRHVVTNHGFTFVLRETNGLAGPKGVIDFSRLPGAYRETRPFSTWQTEGGTGAQPHATCQVAELETEDAIKDWQEGDPFYNYVPFQTGSAGLEDDPATWLPVVKARTGVDLATVADPAAACAGIGGTYTPADAMQTTTAALNSGFLEHETAPLTAEIGALKGAVAAADRAKAAVQAALDLAQAEIARLTAAAVPMTVALPTATTTGKRLAKGGTEATVTGPAGQPVTVRLAVSARRARKLGLASATLASARAALGADGRAVVRLAPKGRAARRLKRIERAVTVTVSARSGDRTAATTATVTR